MHININHYPSRVGRDVQVQNNSNVGELQDRKVVSLQNEKKGFCSKLREIAKKIGDAIVRFFKCIGRFFARLFGCGKSKVSDPLKQQVALMNPNALVRPVFVQNIQKEVRVNVDGQPLVLQFDGSLFQQEGGVRFIGRINNRPMELMLDPNVVKNGIDQATIERFVRGFVQNHTSLAIETPETRLVTSPSKNLEVQVVEEKINFEEIDNEIQEIEKARDKANERGEKAVKERDLSNSIIQMENSFLSIVCDQLAEERKELGLKEEHCNLTAYLYHLAGKPSHIKDDTPIQFVDGEIQPKSDSNPVDQKQVLEHLIWETYGGEMRGIVGPRYEIDKLETLTFGDLKRVLMGVSANVRVKYLELLFYKIKNSSEAQSFRCREYLEEFFPEAFDELKNVDSFEDLTPKQIGYLLQAFRTLPTGEGKKTGKTIEVLGINESDVKASVAVADDFKVLNDFEQWDQLDVGHHAFALSEHPGKTLAYCELRPGMVFALPDNENNAHYYQVVKQFKYKGLIPALFVPVNKNQKAYNSKHEEDVHLVFRGTVTLREWFRDFDFRGVGRKVFDDKKAEILDMVFNYLKTTNSENVILHISGHSLGGCDTQMALALIMDAIANSDADCPLRKVRKVVMTAHNPPRPDPSTNKMLKEAVAKLIEKKDEISVEVDLTHIRYFDKTYQDLVSTLGEVLVGADEDGVSVMVNGVSEPRVFENAGFVRRKLVDITIEEDYGVWGIMERHTFRPFNKVYSGGVNWSFRQWSDAGHELHRGNVEEVFARNYQWPEENRNIIKYLAWYGSLALISSPKNVLHFGINQGLMLPVVHILELLLNKKKDILREEL